MHCSLHVTFHAIHAFMLYIQHSFMHHVVSSCVMFCLCVGLVPRTPCTRGRTLIHWAIGATKCLAELYVMACWLHYTCKRVVSRRSRVTVLQTGEVQPCCLEQLQSRTCMCMYMAHHLQTACKGDAPNIQ